LLLPSLHILAVSALLPIQPYPRQYHFSYLFFIYFHPCILLSFYHYHLYSLLPFHSPISVLHFPWYSVTAYCFYCLYIYIYIYKTYVLPLYILAFSSFSISHFDLHCSNVFSPPKIFNLQPFWGHKMPPYYTTPICLLLNTLQPF